MESTMYGLLIQLLEVQRIIICDRVRGNRAFVGKIEF